MGFFHNIRPPGVFDATSTNNIATRLSRQHRHQQAKGQRDRPTHVVLLQQQQRSNSLSARTRPAAVAGHQASGVHDTWLQQAFVTSDVPVTNHPAGDQAAAHQPQTSSSKGDSSNHAGVDSCAGSQQPCSSSNTTQHNLPEELLRLADASAPVSLPPPHSVPAGCLDNRELDKLVGTLGRNKATWRRALVLSQWLQDSGHVLDDRLCTTLIRVCSEHGQAVTALSVYEWMKSPPDVGGAGLQPTVYTYTAAMRAALAAGLLDRALQVWEDAQAAKCTLDCRLCITYIEVCSRKGLTDRALSMYTAMKAAPRGSKLAPTVHAYTAAMRAATEGGLWAQALSIWEDMREAQVAPTGHAFAAAMSACAAGSNWQQAVTLFEDMCAAGIKPDVVSCTALISALAAAGQWQRSESVVHWMLSTGVRPNVRTFTALLTALGNARQWDRAFEMLELMQHSSWGGVSPNAYTYSALLKCLGECGEWQRAERLFSTLEQQALGHAVSSSSSNAAPSSTTTRHLQASAPADSAADAVVGQATWKQQEAAAAAVGGGLAGGAAASSSQMLGGGDVEAVPGVWGWQAGGSSVPKLIQLPVTPAEQSDPAPNLGMTSDIVVGHGGSAPVAEASNSSSNLLISSSNNSSSDDLRCGAVTSDCVPEGVSAVDPALRLHQESLWVSASQLHGINLDLQLEASATQQGITTNSSSSSQGSKASSSRASPAPEILARAYTKSQQQQQQDSSEQCIDTAVAAVTGVSSDIVAQQLAQLALQQHLAAGMDLQLLMHQQQSQALAALHRAQQQEKQQHQHHQQQQRQAAAPAASAPVRTEQLLQMRQQQQQQQQQQAADIRPAGNQGLINVYVVSSLMQAYERAGKWQACVGALARGAALGVAPTASMYASAISAAGQAGQLAVADALFQQARASGVADQTTFETMVAVLGMAGDPARAEVVLRSMQSVGYQPGDYAYCGLIAGYSLTNDALSAQRVRTRIVREKGPGSVSVHVYNALLAAADRAAAFDKALELLRCMRREGVHANALTQQLAAEVGRKGAVAVEGQQFTAAALSAAMAAAGTLLMQRGVW